MFLILILLFKIYKHDKNLQVDHFLTAILVLALALVIGLGIGHFLGKSKILCYIIEDQNISVICLILI